jgi:predicted HicB family RNase H-like nuclease
VKYRGYEAVVRYSDEDETFVGEVINTRDMLIFDGNDVAEVEQSFHAVVDEYLEDCENEGREAEKPFSGRFVMRLDPDLHRALFIQAKHSGQSLNAYVQEKLSQVVGQS